MRSRVAFVRFGLASLGVALPLACSSSKTSEPTPVAGSSEPASAPPAGWSIDVNTCERNVIKRRTYEGGAESLTIVGPDVDVCVVHVKHTAGRDWTEADCRIPRDPSQVAISSTAIDRMPGTCKLVESGTDTH